MYKEINLKTIVEKIVSLVKSGESEKDAINYMYRIYSIVGFNKNTIKIAYKKQLIESSFNNYWGKWVECCKLKYAYGISWDSAISIVSEGNKKIETILWKQATKYKKNKKAIQLELGL